MFWRKRRYIVVLLAFLGYVSSYTLRVNLSVAIVAMTENRTVYYDNGTVTYVLDREQLRQSSPFLIKEIFDF